MIVADTNVIAYLFIPGVYTKAAEIILKKDTEWVAPILWRSEFRSILTGYIRNKKMSLDTALEIIEEAEKLMGRKEYVVPAEKVMEIVVKSNCSVYYCEYVALAKELKSPLITSDKQILGSFPDTAVSLEKFVIAA